MLRHYLFWGLWRQKQDFVDSLVKFWTWSRIWHLLLSPAYRPALLHLGCEIQQLQKAGDQEVIIYSQMLGDIDEIECFISAAFWFLFSFATPSHCANTATLVSSPPERNILSDVYSGWITLFYFPNWNWRELKMWNTNNANLVGRHRRRAGGRLYVRWTWKANIANEKFLEIGVKPFLCCMGGPVLTRPG